MIVAAFFAEIYLYRQYKKRQLVSCLFLIDINDYY